MDITAGYKAVDLMKQHVARTMNEHCIGGLGGFGGLFELDCTDMPHPVLISGTDGVGTKLRIAQYMNKHDTVGIDCVAMCVNDVICAGAKPLVFLDYIACGKNVPERIAELVAGVAEGCVQAGCALVGGETAEMPGFYPEDEYDLAGFTVGAVDKSKILDNSTMQPGDVIIALPSTGVHSNGFSLVRKIFDLENNPDVLKKTFDGMDKTLGEAPMLAPHQDLCQACAGRDEGSYRQGRFPHYRRRLLREHSPQPESRLLRCDQEERCAHPRAV